MTNAKTSTIKMESLLTAGQTIALRLALNATSFQLLQLADANSHNFATPYLGLPSLRPLDLTNQIASRFSQHQDSLWQLAK
jgi:hypothetical protein